MEVATLAVSTLAMGTSLVALYWSRKQYLFDAELRFRQELSSCVTLYSKVCDALYLMKRERKKTGLPLNEGEEELFKLFEFMIDQYEVLDTYMREILNEDRLKIDKRMLTKADIAKAACERLLDKVEKRFERFKQYNQNNQNKREG